MRLESSLRQRRRFSISNLLSPRVRRVAGFGLLALMACGGMGASHAADATWKPSTGTLNWGDGVNWLSGSAPGATNSLVNPDTATFNSSVAGTLITIDLNRNLRNITFAAGAAGAITFGSAGVNQGNALLLSSGGTLLTSSTTTSAVTVNAPLIIQATSGTGNGSYTFTNNSGRIVSGSLDTSDPNTYKIFLNGNISGGSTTGTITLNFGGNAGHRSNDNVGNEVNGVISNGLAGAVAVNVSTLNNQNGAWKFTNANSSYTGSTTLSLGTLLFTSIANAGENSSLGAGSAIHMAGGTHLKYVGTTDGVTNRTITGTGAFYNQSSGTTLTLNGSVNTGITFRGAGNFNITSLIAGGSGFSRTDGGTVLFSNNGNTFLGNISMSDGAFRGATLFDAGVSSAFGAGSTIGFGQNSGTVGRLEYTGTSTSTNRQVILNNASGAAITGRGVIDVTTAGETLTLTGGVRANISSATNVGELTLRGAGNGEVLGQIGGTPGNSSAITAIKLVKDGTGTWTLFSANTHARETTVNAGVLNIRHNNALGLAMSNEATSTAAGAGTIVANNGTLQLQGGITVLEEQLTLSGGGASGQTGALVNVSETNEFAGTIILAANATISSDAGRLNLTSFTALNGSAAGRVLTLGGAGVGSIDAGLGSNISNLIKNGEGIWTLLGNSTHSGTTTVNAGTLNVMGAFAGTGLTTVANGGTLAGTGPLDGAVTVANGGTLSVGDAEIAGSTGMFTVNGNLILNNNSILRMDLGSSSDLILANGGQFTLDGLLLIGKGAGLTTTTETYQIIDYLGTLTDNGLMVGKMVGYDGVLSLDTLNRQVHVTLTALAGQYWDGGDTSANGTVDGGSGVWTNAGGNWTNSDGSTNTTWNDAADKVAFFEGAAGGTVTVADTVTVTGLQFGKDYTLVSGGGGIQTSTAATEVRVIHGVTATLDVGIQGSGGINKTGEGTLVFTAAAGTNTYSGATLVTEGTLKIGSNNTLPTGTVLTVGTSGPAGGTGTVATLDLTDASQQVAGFNVASNSATTLNSLVTIGAGQTLRVTGNAGLKIGIPNTLQTRTQAVFTGGGALVVDNVLANFEAGMATTNTLVPGVTIGDTDAGNNRNEIVANLSGLGSLTANVNEFRVAHGLNATTTLTLSNTANNITANTVNVGNSASMNGGSGTMILGEGTNVITANTLNVGVSKGVSTVRFASTAAGAGTLVMTGKTPGTGIDITLGATLGTSTGASPGGTLDLRGHIAHITADDVVLGNRNANNNGGANGTIYFDGGTFTARTLDLGRLSGNGGTADTFTATRGAGTIIVSAGTFTVSEGGSFVMGTYSNTNGFGSVTGTLTISGGTFITNVDILEGGGAQSTTTNTVTTINLTGGTLDMTGKNIGNATNTINNVNLQAGVLKDVGQINGGGDISKTGTGTLVIQGDSGYTGATTVAAGTLLVSNDPNGTGSATGTNNVAVNGTATLGGNGRIAGSVALASGTTLAPGGNATSIAGNVSGVSTDTGTVHILGDLSVASGATLALNLKTSGSHGLTADFDPVTHRLTNVSGTSTDGGNDRVVVSGVFSLDAASTIAVTLGSGAALGFQDTFDLLDWSELTNPGFAIPTAYYDDGDGLRTGRGLDNADYFLHLPDLSAYHPDWVWDVSLFGTTGVIAIVPEPGRAVLVLLGVAGLMLRRRRSK